MEEKFVLDLAGSTATDINKAKRLETLWPQVERSIAEGVKHRVILAKLNEMGFSISMGSYKMMIHRIRAKQKKSAKNERRSVRRLSETASKLNLEKKDESNKRFKHDVERPVSEW